MRRRKINLPGPRWLQFIYIIIVVDLIILGIVAGTCASTHCSNTDWSNRMFWGGMAVIAIGIPAVGANFMGLAGSTGVGTNPLNMGAEAAVMNDVVRYEQGQRGKRMKFFWWFFAIGAGAILISMLITQMDGSVEGAPPDFSKTDRALPSKVVSQITEEVERNASFIKISGVTVAVWDDKAPVYIESFGNASDDPDARYAIGGVTEQFTAAAVLQLVESGDLALDGLVTVYLPDLPDNYEFITVIDLLTHTSGLAGDSEVMDAIEATLGENPWQSDTTYTASDFIKLSQEVFTEPLTTPGTEYHHSEQGFRILGLIIETKTGQNYNDYIAASLTGPAGMSATTPCEIDSSNVVQGHSVEGSNLVDESLPNTSFAYASGNLCSSAADLVQWQYALSSEMVVTEDSLREMYLPATTKTGELIKVDTEDTVGLGNIIGQSQAAGVYSQNEGSVPGYDALMHYYHVYNVTVVILSDTEISETRKDNGNDLNRIMEQILWTMDDNWLLE